MVASSDEDFGMGRAARRSRWWSWEIVTISGDAEDCAFVDAEVFADVKKDSRSDRTDQVGLERISAGDGLEDVEKFC